MAVALKPIDTFGETNPFTSTPSPTFGDIAAEDRSAPGLFSPKTFGQLGGGNGSGTTGALSAITQTTAGSTSGLGYSDPSEGHGGTRGSGGINGGGSAAGNGIKLAPDEPIGLPAAKVPDIKPKPSKPSTPSTPSTPGTNGGDDQGTGTEGSGGGGPSRNDNFDAGASASRPDGDMPGRLAIGSGTSGTGNGGTSDAEAADINRRAGF